MKGREALFSALRLTTDDDLAAGVAGAKAEADPARMARVVAFIMVELKVSVGRECEDGGCVWAENGLLAHS